MTHDDNDLAPVVIRHQFITVRRIGGMGQTEEVEMLFRYHPTKIFTLGEVLQAIRPLPACRVNSILHKLVHDRRVLILGSAPRNGNASRKIVNTYRWRLPSDH
jgi:hypothetical protein